MLCLSAWDGQFRKACVSAKSKSPPLRNPQRWGTRKFKFKDYATRLVARIPPLSGLVRPKEGMDLAHGQRDPFLWLFPRKHTHFGFRSEHCAFHRDGVRVRG